MALKTFFQKGIKLQFQRPGLPESGPITPCLKAMAVKDAGGHPVSPIGADVARLFGGRKTLVVFTHTAGSGITPWRGLIVLDSEYKGEGQIASPAKIGLVAHELTHLLQRDLRNPNYWPSGWLRPSLSRLWVGDSTNYMEVLAYLVGWTVEHDLIASQGASPDISEARRVQAQGVVKNIRDRLATLSGPDARNASRLVLKTFPDNAIYRKNYARENRLPDGRIPPGPWHDWLRQLGFSRQSVDHIMILATQGKVDLIDLKFLEKSEVA
jgi:hypothetical protein